MCFTNDLEDQVAIVQMNAALRQAQVELLSAQCATAQLQVKFSPQQIVRHADKDILRRAIKTSTSLHEYYSSLEQQSRLAQSSQGLGVKFSEKVIKEAIARVADYMQQQRDHYLPQSMPLSEPDAACMQGFFTSNLLASVRVVELRGKRIPNPPFYREATEMGIANLPELAHMPSVTFGDVLVFNDQITERDLFHALVLAVQFRILGLERHTELFVRAFLRTQSRLSVPLVAHVFLLESRFMENRTQGFSVEDHVRQWIEQRHY